MNRFAALLVVLLASGVVGCGEDSPTCPASTTHRYDGYWIGTTSEGLDLQMRVVNSVIVQFRTGARYSSSCYIGIGYSDSPAAALNDRQFSFVLPATWTMPAIEVGGQFDGDRNVSGTIGAMTLPAGMCGNKANPAVAKAALTFTAAQ